MPPEPEAVGPRFPGFDNAVEIGRGGFGVVYRADDVVLHRTVAIKVLATTLHGSEVERFQREAEAMSVMSGHPNVVPVFSTGVTAEGRPFLVMPYLIGGSLADRVAEGPLHWPVVVEVGVQVAGALESAHRQGIVHRDVKPDNILTSQWGQAALADFGIARLAGAFETVSRNVTASIVYAAPEVLDGQAPTPQSDIYSLGATLHHLLTGRAAFAAGDDETLVAQYLRISRDPVPDLRSIGVPDDLNDVIARAMSKDPADRQQTALQFQRELQAVGSAAGVAPTSNSTNSTAMSGARTIGARTGEAPKEPGGRRRTVLTTAAALIVAIGLLVVWLVNRSSNSSPAAGPGGVPGSVTTGVDASPSGIPLTLGDSPSVIPLRVPAGVAADIHIDGIAGQRVLGQVTLSRKPDKPVPVALLFNESPAENKDITELNVAIDPVAFDSTGTWVLRIGPSAEPIVGTAQIGLAPADLKLSVQVDGTVDVNLSRTRQRAFIQFTGHKGQKIVADWTWKGADPLSTTLNLVAPDGTALTSWGALATGQSAQVALASDGTYTISATIDGDGTGAATVAVTTVS